MNDVQAVEVKVLHGNVHGLSDRRRRCAFEFETQTLAATDNQQVKLCPLMCAPFRIALTWERRSSTENSYHEYSALNADFSCKWLPT